MFAYISAFNTHLGASKPGGRLVRESIAVGYHAKSNPPQQPVVADFDVARS